MRLLDGTLLDGPHSATITVRPSRLGVPIANEDLEAFAETIAFETQVWGGAATVLLPTSAGGRVAELYEPILPGSEIDWVEGADHYALFNMSEARFVPASSRPSFGRQLAVALLEYGKQSTYRPLRTITLDETDPWREIYAACLGVLSEAPHADLLRDGNYIPTLQFDDFVTIERATAKGSLEGLLDELEPDRPFTPRRLSMVHLPHGSAGSSAIRTPERPLPDREFARHDGGPNVVVVCTKTGVSDYALLWNLRAAYGDGSLPIGIPLEELSADALVKLARHPRLSRNGMAVHSIYVTSTTVPLDDLRRVVGTQFPDREVAIVPPEDVATFGAAPGWTREETLSWRAGTATLIPLAPESRREVFGSTGFNESVRMFTDVKVPSHPFPKASDVRITGMNQDLYGGSASTWTSGRRVSDLIKIRWPSPLLAVRSVSTARGYDLRESEPGRAARILLDGLADPWELSNLAHAPILRLLEEMAARTGFGWYKRRLREESREADPLDAVGPTPDELPEKSFHDFKRALGGNERATKYWLLWAEQNGLMVKGFPLLCSMCRAKQWTPVAGFTPPIVCRGCGEEMRTPFGDRPIVDFKYRISERLRRVFQHDALAHLLVFRHFGSLFEGASGSALVGAHPGMEVLQVATNDLVGEADTLLAFRSGDLVPIEVKRSYSGVTQAEVDKLGRLSEALSAPWSAIAVCDYGEDAPEAFLDYEVRSEVPGRARLLLSYDALLSSHAVWGLGSDPFAWVPLTRAQIADREGAFVRGLASRGTEGLDDMYAFSMLHRPSLHQAGEAAPSDA